MFWSNFPGHLDRWKLIDRGVDMTKNKRQFEASFKLEVVRMVRDQGLSVSAVCRTMQVGETALRHNAGAEGSLCR